MFNPNNDGFSLDQLTEKAKLHRGQGKQVVVVQGLGFVGAAVAAVVSGATDKAGEPLYFVIGVEIPTSSGQWKVNQINRGRSPITSPDMELEALIYRGVQVNRNLCATVVSEVYVLADVIIVDIPLDVVDRVVSSAQEVDINMDSFQQSIATIGKYMRSDALVLIETTVPFGACQKIILPIIRSEREQRNIHDQIYLAHAYERVMPGPKYIDSIRRYWRTFSGIDEPSARKARQFLASFIDVNDYSLYELDDSNASELAKLLENSYRAVNIAFIYEWALLAEATGINLFSVVESIRVRKGTHDNIRLPGFGVGGYCLTKDSLLAQWSADHLFKAGITLDMTLAALRVNYQMPLHALHLLTELFEGNLAGKTFVVCGVSYLPEVSDTRNSPSELFVDRLQETGARVLVHDPYVSEWSERPDVPIFNDLSDCLSQADGIVFAVPHRLYYELSPEQLLELTSKPVYIVDAQNVITDEKAEALYGLGCCISGVGKGHWRNRGYLCQK